MDVFWLHIGGVSPAEFIARYADRAGYYHFKDGAKTPEGPTFIELGRGEVDIAGAAAEARKHPLEWVVYEQDYVQQEPGLSVRQSFDHLKEVGL